MLLVNLLAAVNFADVFQIKNVWKIKNVKNVTKIKKRKKRFYIYAVKCITSRFLGGGGGAGRTTVKCYAEE